MFSKRPVRIFKITFETWLPFLTSHFDSVDFQLTIDLVFQDFLYQHIHLFLCHMTEYRLMLNHLSMLFSVNPTSHPVAPQLPLILSALGVFYKNTDEPLCYMGKRKEQRGPRAIAHLTKTWSLLKAQTSTNLCSFIILMVFRGKTNENNGDLIAIIVTIKQDSMQLKPEICSISWSLKWIFTWGSKSIVLSLFFIFIVCVEGCSGRLKSLDLQMIRSRKHY